MSELEPVLPFRWDITRRNQLGKLIGELELDNDARLEEELYRAASGRDWLSIDRTIPITTWFQRELVRCTARIIAFSDNSDLYFVGRSLESVFDFLSGVLLDTSWAGRLNLLHFSMSDTTEKQVRQMYPQALSSMRRYLAHIELAPGQIAQRERPVAFVDIVATGATFGNLIGLLNNWCAQTNRDWGAVRHKLRLVGLPQRWQTSPKTVRWQQEAEWTGLMEKGAVKNVSIPSALFHYFGAAQSKTTESYSPWRWGDPAVMEPNYSKGTRMALRMAVSLFDEGQTKQARDAFARELSKQPAMQHTWFRELVQEM